MIMTRSDFDATNRHQLSMVCTLIDHRNDFNMFKHKWKTAGDWFHCKINLDLSSRDFTGYFRSRGGKLEERFQAIHPSHVDICPSRFWL